MRPPAAIDIAACVTVNEWLTTATRITVDVIDAMALVIIIVGTVTAFGSAMRLIFAHGTHGTGRDRRAIWLGYARWLVAGLTFQLAADIVESTTAESWDAVGRLAAVAAIRTFLNYFLERDVEEMRARDGAKPEGVSV